MNIDLVDETTLLQDVKINMLKEVLLHAAKIEDIQGNAELSVVIVHDNDIQQLNKSYRDKDQPTDVLSFPLVEDFNEIDEESPMPLMLGDIIISIDKVEEQAKRFNHSFDRELAFLAVHGFLHLIGFTHDDEDEEKLMFAKQEEILKEFQLERE